MMYFLKLLVRINNNLTYLEENRSVMTVFYLKMLCIKEVTQNTDYQ